jgi:hypothetical protein
MKLTKQQRLIRIASNVRKWAEKARPRNRPKNLEFMCGRASGELFKRLAAAGFNPTIVIGACHAFIECDGYVLDVTATQFNHWNFLEAVHTDCGLPHREPYKAVEVVTRRKAKKDPLWMPERKWPAKRFTNLKAALAYQKKQGWSIGQRISLS